MKRKNTKILKAIGIAAATVAVCVTPVIADEISDLENEKNKIESEVDNLEAQLTDILTDLENMEERAAKLGDDIEKGKDDLEAAEEKQEDQYADMKLRVQYMYENNEANVADIFLTSESFSDALNKSEYVQRIYEYDRNELEELDRTAREIESINDKLAADLSELEKEQEKATAKQNELNDLIESKQSEVTDLDTRIAAVQAEIARKAAEEEAKRQAELERQRQAENNATESSGSEDLGGGISSSDSDNNTRNASAADSGGDSGNNTPTTQAQQQQQQQSKPASNQNNNNTQSNNNASSGGGSAIVSTAYNYIGVPYVYGGSSPRGFDCSGLVQYVYRQNGISLPRTSGAQAGVGRGVSLSDAQPGDIVCYPGHVAIYIGGGKVIHAPYPGRRVEVASANMMRITTVRRVL